MWQLLGQQAASNNAEKARAAASVADSRNAPSTRPSSIDPTKKPIITAILSAQTVRAIPLTGMIPDEPLGSRHNRRRDQTVEEPTEVEKGYAFEAGEQCHAGIKSGEAREHGPPLLRSEILPYSEMGYKFNQAGVPRQHCGIHRARDPIDQERQDLQHDVVPTLIENIATHARFFE